MPRIAAPTRQDESRRELEQRARQAAMPTLIEKKRKWPFPVANEESVSETASETAIETVSNAAIQTDKDRRKSAHRDEHQLEQALRP